MARPRNPHSARIESIALKPQDVAIALKALLLENRSRVQSAGEKAPVSKEFDYLWTLKSMTEQTHISVGEVYNAVERLKQSRLFRTEGRIVRRRALEEFLLHGVPYAFPISRGPVVRGVPTAHAAPVLKELLLSPEMEVPVWPYDEGIARGISFSPLYPRAPIAALEDREFYDLLALTDTLRSDPRVRERTMATEMLRSRILQE